MPAVPSEIEELNALNKRLLQAITDGDWETYKQLCDPSLTCFEPESKGYLVEGLDFHKYYFNLTAAKKTTSVGKEVDASAPAKVTVTNLKIRLLGNETAVVTYNRLMQVMRQGSPETVATEETRVWHKMGDGKKEWKNIHFHRSFPS